MSHPTFPFTAIEGQADLQLALILAAITPRLGGVLIEGPRGTAKTTTARALADLLAPAPFVTVPLGCSLEHLTGSLDLTQVLNQRDVRFAPGLLAKAHGGVLYVDEINLLPDTLVDVLLDVAASGINYVERDGISHTHASNFVLIGTMNPQEGGLRPQLLDRLGLSVGVSNVHDVQLRQRIVRTRLAFDHDPEQFLQNHAIQQAHLQQRLQCARTLIAHAPPLHHVDEQVSAAAAKACITHGVDGLRADIALLRAAQALAAWEAAGKMHLGEAITTHPEWVVRAAHVQRVASMVLRHRQTDHPGDASHPERGSEESEQTPETSLPLTPSDHSGGRNDQSTPPQHFNGPSNEPSDTRDPQSIASNPDNASEGDWGSMPAEPVQRAQTDNPLLQQWLKQLSQAAADSAKKF